MDQLVEGVLAVGARLAPEDFAGFGGDRGAVPTHGLAVGFHVYRACGKQKKPRTDAGLLQRDDKRGRARLV